MACETIGEGFSADFIPQCTMTLHRASTFSRLPPSWITLIPLNESFLRQQRIDSQLACLSETARGTIRKAFPADCRFQRDDQGVPTALFLKA
jgi:hypothetical protein